MRIYLMRWFQMVLLGCLISWMGQSAYANTFQSGKDYVTFPAPVFQEIAPKGSVTVMEFFSYECPACFAADPVIQAWAKTQPKRVIFSRVPVVFRSNWEPYARAYYVAQQLGLLSKVHTPFFNAIHIQHQPLNTSIEVADFFAHYGTTSDAVLRAWSAPVTEQNLTIGEQRMIAYQLNQVPSIVVGGTYRVDASMVQGDPKRLMAVVQFLVTKSLAHR